MPPKPKRPQQTLVERIPPSLPLGPIARLSLALGRSARTASGEALSAVLALTRAPDSHDLRALRARIIDRTRETMTAEVSTTIETIAADSAVFALRRFARAAKAQGVDLREVFTRRARADAKAWGPSAVNRSLEREFGISLDNPALAETLDRFARENARLLPDLLASQADMIAALVADAVARGERLTDLAAEIRAVTDKTATRARQIATNQVLRLHAALNCELSRQAGVERYLWMTMEDDRVRDVHQRRHGRRYRWDRPPRGGHPGEDWGCRCWAVPQF